MLKKRTYDPFNIYFQEYIQGRQNNTTNIEELEKKAKLEWISLEKETKKIYNIHADNLKKKHK